MKYYFASDIHLGAGSADESRRVEARFTEWLDTAGKDAKAIYLLGDVFDFWFEYHRVVPKGFVRTLAKLQELTSKGVNVVMLTGNHDMWVRDYLQHECGIELHAVPQLLDLDGRKIFIAHGDNTNIGNKPLLRLMNTAFRSRTLKSIFSWLVHPDLLLAFGQKWSGHSRKSHGCERDPRYLQPLCAYAAQIGTEQHVDCFIFGHMHIPYTATSPERIVFLGDWHSRPNYAVMEAEGLPELKFID